MRPLTELPRLGTSSTVSAAANADAAGAAVTIWVVSWWFWVITTFDANHWLIARQPLVDRSPTPGQPGGRQVQRSPQPAHHPGQADAEASPRLLRARPRPACDRRRRSCAGIGDRCRRDEICNLPVEEWGAPHWADDPDSIPTPVHVAQEDLGSAHSAICCGPPGSRTERRW